MPYWGHLLSWWKVDSLLALPKSLYTTDVCSNQCAEPGGTCCGSGSCLSGETCCNSDSCAPVGGLCCGDYVCEEGEQCCDNNHCAPSASVCCGEGYCDEGSTCCGDGLGCAKEGYSCCEGTSLSCPTGDLCCKDEDGPYCSQSSTCLPTLKFPHYHGITDEVSEEAKFELWNGTDIDIEIQQNTCKGT